MLGRFRIAILKALFADICLYVHAHRCVLFLVLRSFSLSKHSPFRAWSITSRYQKPGNHFTIIILWSIQFHWISRTTSEIKVGFLFWLELSHTNLYLSSVWVKAQFQWFHYCTTVYLIFCFLCIPSVPKVKASVYLKHQGASCVQKTKL